MIRIDANEVPPRPWKNGGGWTRELLLWPHGEPDWQLRISVATISGPGPFSRFPGVHRAFAVVSGAGLTLRIDGREHSQQVETEPCHFSGEAEVFATPLAGTTHDLNLMYRTGRGAIRRVVDDNPWISAASQRGLFAGVAGKFTIGANAPLLLAAHTLMWMEQSSGAAWHFSAQVSDSRLPAWWLEYSPSPNWR